MSDNVIENNTYSEDVHSMNGEPSFGKDPKTGAPGFAFFETKCGKRINEGALVLTDDADAVTCVGCKGGSS